MPGLKRERPESDESDSDGDDKDDDEFDAPLVDIEAIASAKSLGDAMRILAPQLEGLPRRSRGKYGKRKHLTPEEKAELTRRRNRENARSTRKRRKMYIKHLQDVAETLKSRQEALSKMTHPKIEVDYEGKRRAVVDSFFEFRSSGVVDLNQWATIIDPDFRLTLPVTPYRSYPTTEVRGSLRVCEGASALVADTASLHSMLHSVAVKCRENKARPNGGASSSGSTATSLQYVIDPQSVILVNDKLMCQWNLTMSFDSAQQIDVIGMSKMRFNTDHKLMSIDLRFDVMGLTQLIEGLESSAEA